MKITVQGENSVRSWSGATKVQQHDAKSVAPTHARRQNKGTVAQTRIYMHCTWRCGEPDCRTRPWRHATISSLPNRSFCVSATRHLCFCIPMLYKNTMNIFIFATPTVTVQSCTFIDAPWLTRCKMANPFVSHLSSNAYLVYKWRQRGKDKKKANNFAYKTLLPEYIPQSINI